MSHWLENYQKTHGKYPPGDHIRVLVKLGAPTEYTTDGWGNTIRYISDGDEYVLSAQGLGDTQDEPSSGGQIEAETASGYCAIDTVVFCGGTWSWPAGISPPVDRRMPETDEHPIDRLTKRFAALGE